MITSIRGFNDILPPETTLWQHIEGAAREVFKVYGFSEIRVPVMEKTELFAKGIGDTTDIVEKEMYTFSDRNNESVTLRPEGTASVVRAYIEHRLCNMPCAKLYYIGPMFRYERPQKGRYRQFHQIGAEVLGISDPMSDAETLDMLLAFFKKIGLDDIELQLNSLGCKNCRPVYREKLKQFLSEKKEQLCDNCQRRIDTNPLRVIDCKSRKCVEVTDDAPSILDYICNECKTHFEEVKGYLYLFGAGYSINPRMVRGLDYYTRTTFEITSDKLGSQNAVAAGGRYDGLVRELGGPDVSGFGFAIGMERLAMLLKEGSGSTSHEAGIFIVCIGKEAETEGIRILKELRERSLRAEIGYHDKGIKGQMKMADKLGARFTLILGDDEISKREITFKDMKTGVQEKVDIEGIAERVIDEIAQVKKV
ncbi:MAG: histidine--tRNA ligase [Deltaproteobacteria bacterium GWC2_42_11]|nr:MAG: histidine--tRNA ligase [Deltaproteobacteria bacterium GWC2_42_11]HBO84219.1 histidine--tRNA ligase [Deltaproteobacteria bacterium]